jgi:Ca2+-binding RTX toxin-like protein
VSTPTSLETLFLQLVTEARAKVGARPLTFDGELLDSSDAHSTWMDQTNIFSHTGVNGSSPGDRMTAAGYGAMGWGENIAYVSGGMTEAAVRQLHANLMNSPGHYANIVRGSFEEIGIGLKAGTINGYSVVFVTQNFGTPSASERAERNDVGTTTTTPTIAETSFIGTSGSDVLLGNSGDNTLKGARGSDILNGNGGDDILFGGTGRDVFRFDSAAEANGDTVSDFVEGRDRVDLTAIDANTVRSGDQAFTFIGTRGFHGVAGELRTFEVNGNTYLDGDLDGNGLADFRIKFVGSHTFADSDILC